MQKSWKLWWDHNCLVAELSGEVDHHIAAELRSELDEEIRSALEWRSGLRPAAGEERSGEQAEAVHLVLDFSGVTFMDSSGIGVVLGRYNLISPQGGEIFIAGCDRYVDRILEMAGIYIIARRVETVETALECAAEMKTEGGEKN